jgi:hypothetical protein
MAKRLRLHSMTHCYHEAGHAVAFWHHGIEIEYVTMNSSNPGHFGETKTVDHETASLAEIEAEMQCAAAGEIAQKSLSRLSEERSDDGMIRLFALHASGLPEDPNVWVTDGMIFAGMGLKRDAKIRRAAKDAATGPETWLAVFREAERLIQVELWPAVKAVGDELSWSEADLHNEDVVALATTALKRAGGMST